ncbi:MAG: endolytic transglycosylase MltG [Acidimicrobiales bacterium]
MLWVVAGVVVLVIVVGVAWYEFQANPIGVEGRQVEVQVRQGESTASVASALAARGVVSSALGFRLSMLLPGSPTIDAGGYQFRRNESFSAVHAVLARGPDVFTVAVAPGNTLSEVELQLGNLPGKISTSFVEAVRHGTVRSAFEPAGSSDLEGLIGTGTYRILPGESGRTLLEAMTARFNSQASAAGVTPAAAATLGVTPYQLVTVASISQKEGYFDRYLGKVARVVYNRLAAAMPLDMTSTVLYTLGQDGGTVTTADRKIDSPYNTYLHTGLTPTPICSVSEAALAAAASPPAGTWLYFVVVSRNGTTLFTSTYQQQLANERLARSRGIG